MGSFWARTSLNEIPTQTLFIALNGNTINLWVLNGADVHFEKKCIEMKNAFKQIRAGVDAKCENRSMNDREGDAPRNEESCQNTEDSTTNSLRDLFDSVIFMLRKPG